MKPVLGMETKHPEQVAVILKRWITIEQSLLTRKALKCHTQILQPIALARRNFTDLAKCNTAIGNLGQNSEVSCICNDRVKCPLNPYTVV